MDSPFGEEVLGIWPSDAKRDLINCVHLASHPMILATGDDNGVIKLFKFPCQEKEVKIIENLSLNKNKFLFFKFDSPKQIYAITAIHQI